MKKLLMSLLFLCVAVIIYPQDFFRENSGSGKSILILMNPTAGNLEVIQFLIGKKLLDIDPDEVSLVGVYHASQEYDFSKSAEYIAKNNLNGYFLHEVRGDLEEGSLFMENSCSPDFRKIFENSMGVIFFGGQDIPPSVYGEENLYSETTDPGRHYFEVSFLFHLIGGSRNPAIKPLLDKNPSYLVTGFGLGLQSMNVAAGGTLYQDIPAQIYDKHTDEERLSIGKENLHRNYWQNIVKDPMLMGTNLHRIHFTEDPFFGKTVRVSKKEFPLGYSSHHQAIKKVGKNFRVTALSPDGKVIEGLAHSIYPNVFSVQFHPEVPSLYEDRGLLKFNPDDSPLTLHQMLGKKSLKFHKKYWGHISKVIDSNSEPGR
jgi:putative glutamine amidotransferase